ncbi:MAG: threonine-phosphate decarboxylase CobD [Motiliproteus sp.]|nr:threonine-phosphate decarboxylase CobD [Motiliproteus sp.]
MSDYQQDNALGHGGRLLQAVADYGIPRDQWLDLSTGINPISYPAAMPPVDCWQRLPEQEDGLETAAASYYGSSHVLAVPGSQAAIQLLPQLREHSRVTVVSPTYSEHFLAWHRSGHQVTQITHKKINDYVNNTDVLVLVNPNNPTGRLMEPSQLQDWHRRLSNRGGWLVVDEAFMDSTPEYSLAMESPPPGLILLRSAGKFFGLAGIRCGFVIAEDALLEQLAIRLGPWSISCPSRIVCRQALEDQSWQQLNRAQLRTNGQRLQQLLLQQLSLKSAGSSLFQTVKIHQPKLLFEALAQQGILTRCFPQSGLLRLGLPGNESQWLRLQQELAEIRPLLQ